MDKYYVNPFVNIQHNVDNTIIFASDVKNSLLRIYDKQHRLFKVKNKKNISQLIEGLSETELTIFA